MSESALFQEIPEPLSAALPPDVILGRIQVTTLKELQDDGLEVGIYAAHHPEIKGNVRIPEEAPMVITEGWFTGDTETPEPANMAVGVDRLTFGAASKKDALKAYAKAIDTSIRQQGNLWSHVYAQVWRWAWVLMDDGRVIEMIVDIDDTLIVNQPDEPVCMGLHTHTWVDHINLDELTIAYDQGNVDVRPERHEDTAKDHEKPEHYQHCRHCGYGRVMTPIQVKRGGREIRHYPTYYAETDDEMAPILLRYALSLDYMQQPSEMRDAHKDAVRRMTGIKDATPYPSITTYPGYCGIEDLDDAVASTRALMTAIGGLA